MCALVAAFVVEYIMLSPSRNLVAASPNRRCARKAAFAFLLLSSCWLSTVQAQQPGTEAPKPQIPADPETKSPPVSSKEVQAYESFWYGNTAHTRQAAAAQMVSAGNPWLMLSLGLVGEEHQAWVPDLELDPDQAPILKKQWLKYVPNGQPLFEIPSESLHLLPLPQRQEALVFGQTLIFTAQTPLAVLEKGAKANEGLLWANLNAAPGKHQGQLITLKGWLKRLVPKAAPPVAVAQFVTHYYEGALYTGFGDRNPVYVTFTELPKSIEPAEQMDQYVQLTGYYFKKYRNFSEKGIKEGLVVMARTFTVLTNPKLADAKEAPALNDSWLKFVKDDREFPRLGKDEEDFSPQEKVELKAFTEAQVNVAKVPVRAFAASALEHDWVTFSHLFNEPTRFRGKVVPLKGQLKMLRKIEATVEAEKLGVKHCYEGWIYTDTRNSPPVCVVFGQLPKGVQLGEKVDYQVSCNGYFFKRYLYLTGDSQPMRTLFFFAPTFDVAKTADRGEWGSSITSTVLLGIVILAAITTALIVGLNLLFRRNDARVRKSVAASRQRLLEASATGTDGGPIYPEPGQNGASDRELPAAPAGPDENRPRFEF